MKKLLLLLFILLAKVCPAQYIITKLWDKTLGGNKDELAELGGTNNSVMKCYQINDGRILTCASSNSSISGDKTQANWNNNNKPDAWLVAVEGNSGQKVWDRHYGGFEEDGFEDLTPIGHNRHLLLLTAINSAGNNGTGGDYTVPYTYAPITGPRVRYLLLDSTWNVTGDRLWAGSGGILGKKILWQDTSYCLFLNGSELYHSDLVDTLCTNNNNLGQPVKMAVICYDSAGNWKWDKPYGSLFGNKFPVDIISNGSGYLIISYGGGFAPDCDLMDTSLASDVSIYSVDAVGNVLWQRFYGGVSQEAAVRSLIKTSDGNFLFVAISNSPQGGEVSQPNPATLGAIHTSVWVVKIDSTGGILWDKRYGGCSGIGNIRAAIKTLDNGYLIGASTLLTAQLASCDISENGFGQEDYWVLKLDSMGNKQWDKRWGGSGTDYLHEVMQLSDSSYVAAGISKSDSSGSKTQNNWDITDATGDYWLVHFKADKVVGLNEFANENIKLTIMPNPSSNVCTVTCPVTNGTLTIYDMTGRGIHRQFFSEKVALDLSALSGGMYIVELRNKLGWSVKAKVLKE